MKHYYAPIRGFFDFQDVYREAVRKAPDEAGTIFVEIGSYHGKSAAFMGVEILNSGKSIVLYGVDTFDGRGLPGYGVVKKPGVNKDPLLQEPDPDGPGSLGTTLKAFMENTWPVREAVVPVAKPSVEAAQGFQDESVDFVFIDASHDYLNVLADLETWWPKVESGGIFAGHDYKEPDVRRAVAQFAKNEGVEARAVSANSWRIDKP